MSMVWCTIKMKGSWIYFNDGEGNKYRIQVNLGMCPECDNYLEYQDRDIMKSYIGCPTCKFEQTIHIDDMDGAELVP